jgi:hypothetical protein
VFMLRSEAAGRTCNYARKCALLMPNGKNIGDTLIAEELAVPFVCSATRCQIGRTSLKA